MDLKLLGKKALISGSSAGIGFAIARILAAEGMEVIINSKDEGSLRFAVESLEALAPGRVHGIAADLSTSEGATLVIERFPRVDLLVNNLGVYEASDFFETSDAAWQRMFEINMMSGVRLSRHYLKNMLDRGEGRVVFLSSETGLNPDPAMVHYSASKAVLLSISRGLAELTKGSNVTVNSILPGPTRTEGIERYVTSLFRDLSPEAAEREFLHKVRPTSLIERLASPDEVASVVAFLASPQGALINGHALRVEGGSVRTIA